MKSSSDSFRNWLDTLDTAPDTEPGAKFNKLIIRKSNIDPPNVSLKLIQSLINLSNSFSGLVNLKITSTNKIILDISELQKHVEYLLAEVKAISSRFTGF